MKLIRYNDPTPYYSNWDAFFADPFRAFAPLFSPRATSAYTTPEFAVEWYEDDDHYHARIELPGVTKEQLNLDAEDGLLRIGYERAGLGESAATERFERYLRTPEGIDVSGIGASLQNGLLDLSFPKAPERKPVSIKVS